MALRDLVVSVLFQDNASRSLNDVDRNASGLGKSLAGVAATLGGIFALGKMKDLAVDMVEAAGEAEALNAQFEMVFGTLQDEANEAVNAMAEDFGMLPSRLSPTLTKITSMFKGFGMSTEDSMEASAKAVELAADAAAFYDVSMQDSSGALTSFLKGNTNAAESIGIFATAAGMASFASDKLGLNWKTLDEGGRQLVRLKYIETMQGAAGATGQAAREADGYENVLGNLQQSWVDLKAKLGMAIFDVAIDGMKSMASFMSNINTDGIVKSLKAFGGYMTDTFGPAFSVIKDIAGAAIGVIKSFGKTISDSWGSIKGVVTPVIKTLATFAGVITAISASSLIFSAVFAGIGAAIAFLTSPIALVAAGITALVIGFQAAYKHSEPFRKVIDGLVGTFKGLFQILSGNSQKGSDIMRAAGLDLTQINAIYDFADTVRDAFGKVKAIFDSVTSIFNGEHKGAIDILAGAGFSEGQIDKIRAFGYGLKDAFDRVGEVFSGLGTLMSGGGSMDLLSALGFSPEAIGHITGFIENVKTHAGELVTFLGAKWAELQPGIATLLGAFVIAKDTIGEVFTTLLSILSPIFDALVVAFKIVADVAVMVFHNIIAPAVGFVISMFQAMWGAVGPILSLLGAAIGVAFGILKVVWDTILKPVAAWLLGAFGASFEAAKPHVEAIGAAFSTFGGFISGVSDKLKAFSGFLKNIKIPDWVSNIGGKIAGAASYVGGMVSNGKGVDGSHSTGLAKVEKNGYIAELHKDESVLTAQQSNSLRSMGILGNRGDLPVLNLPTGGESPDASPKLSSPIATTSAGETVTKTENNNVFNFHISGENAKDIRAEVRHEVEAIFLRLNAGRA